jgi:uncharacterized membrane protein
MGLGGGWGGLIVALALFVSTLVVVGIGAAWFVRHFRGIQVAGRETGDSLGTARRRLAAGEISVEEFESIRERLHH